MTTKRVPMRTTDQYGRKIVRVPLAKGRGDATIDEEDFDRLMEWGLSSQWFQPNSPWLRPGRAQRYTGGNRRHQPYHHGGG